MTAVDLSQVDNVWAAIVAAIFLVTGAIGSYFSVRSAMHSKSAAKSSGEAVDQVSNDHTTNLRDDLDRTTDEVRKVDRKLEKVDTKVDKLTGVMEASHLQLAEFMRDIRAQVARQDLIAAKHHPEDMR